MVALVVKFQFMKQSDLPRWGVPHSNSSSLEILLVTFVGWFFIKWPPSNVKWVQRWDKKRSRIEGLINSPNGTGISDIDSYRGGCGYPFLGAQRCEPSSPRVDDMVDFGLGSSEIPMDESTHGSHRSDDFPIIFYIGRPPFVGVTWSKSHPKNHGINQSKIKAWFPPVKFNGWFTWKNQPLKTWSFQPFISNPPPVQNVVPERKKTESQMQLEAQPYSLMRRSQLNSTRWWGFSPTHLKNMFVKLELDSATKI